MRLLIFAVDRRRGAGSRHRRGCTRRTKVPANAVDQPDYCDFFTPALVNRAPVAVAIGTEGAGPVLAQMIRAQVDQLLSPSLGRLARLADQLSQDRRTARAQGRCAPSVLAPFLLRRGRRRCRQREPAAGAVAKPIACCSLRKRSRATSGWSAPAQVPKTC